MVAWAKTKSWAAFWGCWCWTRAPRAPFPTCADLSACRDGLDGYSPCCFHPMFIFSSTNPLPRRSGGSGAYKPAPRWLWSLRTRSRMALDNAINVIVLFQGLLCSWLPSSPATEIFLVSSPGVLLFLHPPGCSSLVGVPRISASCVLLFADACSVTGATAFQLSLNIVNKDFLSTSSRDRGHLLQSLPSLRKPRVILGQELFLRHQ